jgi:uncharacterized protein (TIGR02147 family)
MEKIGILKKEANGEYKQEMPFIKSGGALRNTALVKYQKKMLQHTINAWDEVKPGDMTMHTLSLCMSEGLVEKVREEIRGFKERLLTLVASEEMKPERVYHMNINLFAVTKKNKKK